MADYPNLARRYRELKTALFSFRYGVSEEDWPDFAKSLAKEQAQITAALQAAREDTGVRPALPATAEALDADYGRKYAFGDALAEITGRLERHRERCSRCLKQQPCPEADALRVEARAVVKKFEEEQRG